MAVISNISLDLNINLPYLMLNDDYAVFYSQGDYCRNPMLLCLNNSKVIDIKYLFVESGNHCDSGSKQCTNIRKMANYINCDPNHYHKMYYLAITNENYLCVVCSYKENGIVFFEISHYDIHNNMKIIKYIKIDIPYCVHKCLTHVNGNYLGNCMYEYKNPGNPKDDGNQKIWCSLASYQLPNNKYIFGTLISTGSKDLNYDYKKYTTCIVDLDTFEFTYFNDHALYMSLSPNITKNIILMLNNKLLVVYDVITEEKKIYPCDEIIRHIEFGVEQLLVFYKYNEKNQYILIKFNQHENLKTKNDNAKHVSSTFNVINSSEKSTLLNTNNNMTFDNFVATQISLLKGKKTDMQEDEMMDHIQNEWRIMLAKNESCNNIIGNVLNENKLRCEYLLEKEKDLNERFREIKQKFQDNYNFYESMEKKLNEMNVISQNNNNDECVVCFSKTKRSKVLVPCGHTMYCNECIKLVLESKKCHICKQSVEKCIGIY